MHNTQLLTVYQLYESKSILYDTGISSSGIWEKVDSQIYCIGAYILLLQLTSSASNCHSRLARFTEVYLLLTIWSEMIKLMVTYLVT